MILLECIALRLMRDSRSCLALAHDTTQWKQATWLSVCAGRQLLGRGEDSIFTRLHLGDPHWKVPRKLLARAFSAEEIRCAERRGCTLCWR